MKSRTISNVMLVFDPGEQDTADLIGGTCEKAIQLTQENWGLELPENCRIYVMTSWLGFVFQSAPWPWRILLGATLPFWGFRARRTWPYSAAWTQRYGRRVAIGVKPPRLFGPSEVAHVAQRRDSDSHGRSILGNADDQTIDIRVHEGLCAKGGTVDVSRAIANGCRGYRLSRHARVLAGAVPGGEVLRFFEAYVFSTSGCESDRARDDQRVGDGAREFLE